MSSIKAHKKCDFQWSCSFTYTELIDWGSWYSHQLKAGRNCFTWTRNMLKLREIFQTHKQKMWYQYILLHLNMHKYTWIILFKKIIFFFVFTVTQSVIKYHSVIQHIFPKMALYVPWVSSCQTPEIAYSPWTLPAHILIMTTLGLKHIIRFPALCISMRGIAK